MFLFYYCVFFFFKQKTAYEMRISDWSSDVCSSDLRRKPTSSSSARIPARRPARPRSWESGRSPKENGWRSSGEPDARRYCNAEGAMPMSLKPELQAIHAELPDWRRDQLGRASCRERGCQYDLIWVVAVSLKKKKDKKV